MTEATYMARELLLISGLPGSGKSHLGKELARHAPRELGVSAEHISSGDRIRLISILGRASLSPETNTTIAEHMRSDKRALPLSDLVMREVIGDALIEKHRTDMLILDGYPRNIAQLEHLQELALFEERELTGAIVTEAPYDVMLSRLIKRGPRSENEYMDPFMANLRISSQQPHLSDLHQHLLLDPNKRLHLQYVSTDGEKTASIREGIEAVRTMHLYRNGDDI